MIWPRALLLSRFDLVSDLLLKGLPMIHRFSMKSAVFAACAAVLTACTVAAPMADAGDVVDVMAADSTFATLTAAVVAADIVAPMKRQGPFTVFAPTEAAFAALPDGVLDDLLLPENKDQLVAILTYHVVPGAVTADQLTGQRLGMATINGSNLQIDGRDGVKVETANIVTPDIRATNGVIHAIDRVLMP